MANQDDKGTDDKDDAKQVEKFKIEETSEFKRLVEHLRGDLSAHIIKSINFDEIFDFSLTMINEILSKSVDFHSEDRLIISDSLLQILMICISQPAVN